MSSSTYRISYQSVVSLLFLVLLVTLTSACGKNDTSYASILIYEQQEYIGKKGSSLNEYPNKKLLGTVIEQTNLNERPRKDFSANELKVGTKIYLLEEGILGAQIAENDSRLFSLHIKNR